MSMADTLLAAVDDKSEVGKLLSSLLANPFQLQALRLVLGMQVSYKAVRLLLGWEAGRLDAGSAVTSCRPDGAVGWFWECR
jgi:hypothetical protein